MCLNASRKLPPNPVAVSLRRQPGDPPSARSVFGIRHQIPDSSEPARVPACQGIPARRGNARLPPLASGHAGIRLYRSSRPGDRSVSRARRLYRILSALSRASAEDRSPASRDAHLPLTVGLPPREEDAYLPLRNPTSIAHRHHYVKCLVRRVSAPGRRGPLAPPATQRIYHLPNTMSSGFAGRFLARTQSVTAGSRRTHAQTELRFARLRTIGHEGCTCKGDSETGG